MGKTYSCLNENIVKFIGQQHLFFVATAAVSNDGFVNVSPKGLDTLRVLSHQRAVYLDLTGSGVETIAHLRENGRITLMFCSFERKPKILRVYGQGRVWVPGDEEYESLANLFPDYPGKRAVIDVHVKRAAESCGFGVPLYRFEGERSKLLEWAESKGQKGVDEYWRANNQSSIDGLAGLPGSGSVRRRSGKGLNL